MRKPTRKEVLFGLGGSLLSCAALVLAGSLLLGDERQRTADAVATNQAFVAGAIHLVTEVAADPTATDTELPPYLFPTGTPSPTLIATETLAPTHTSTATLTPFPTATPGLRACQVSAYEACDNNIGVNVGGAAQAVFARLTDHLTSAWEQLARYGDSAKRQDYAADMLFSPVKDELTAHRGPDFWERHGGPGFNPDNYHGYDGFQEVLNADPKEFFKLGSDGIYRAIVEILEEEDFEFALVAAARAKFQVLYPDLDFTRPEVLRAFDDLIRAEAQKAVTENGFKPKTWEEWPGAEKIFGFQSGSFVDGEGAVCIGERPTSVNNIRSSQRPEKLPENEYVRGLENRTIGNDETPNHLDTRGSVMVTMAFDPNRRFLRTDIFSLSSPPDPQRGEPEPLDSEVVDERLEIGRWAPCGPGAAPAPEITVTWTPAAPVFQVTPAETPRPGATPVPTEPPRPTDAPTQPPPETPRPTDAPTQPPQPTATAGNPVETPNPPTPADTPIPQETPPGDTPVPPTPDPNQTPLAP